MLKENEYKWCWFDFETWSSQPTWTGISQLAYIIALEGVQAQSIGFYRVRLPSDQLISPIASWITGLSPIDYQIGIQESEFADNIHRFFQINPAVKVLAGYNIVKFDQHIMRHVLYRSLLTPYEWERNCIVFDLFFLVLMVYTLRPEGIHFHTNDENEVSLKLEDMTRVNGIIHTDKHSALGDVWASMALLDLIKSKKEALFDFFWQSLKNPTVPEKFIGDSETIWLHVSTLYGRKTRYIAPVVCLSSRRKNYVWVCDLRHDYQAENSDYQVKLPMMQINLRHHVLVPFSRKMIQEAPDTLHYLMEDVSIYQKRARYIKDNFQHFTDQAREQRHVFPESSDASQSLYGGQFPDTNHLNWMKLNSKEAIQDIEGDISLKESPHALAFFYVARNFPEQLNDKQRKLWWDIIQNRLKGELSYQGFTWGSFDEELLLLKNQSDPNNQEDQSLLKAITDYGLDFKKTMDRFES